MTRKSTKRIPILVSCSSAIVLGLSASAAFAQQGSEQQPTVGVQQAEPDVNVQTAEPNVRVVPPSGEPNVQGDENVNVRVLPPEDQGAGGEQQTAQNEGQPQSGAGGSAQSDDAAQSQQQ